MNVTESGDQISISEDCNYLLGGAVAKTYHFEFSNANISDDIQYTTKSNSTIDNLNTDEPMHFLTHSSVDGCGGFMCAARVDIVTYGNCTKTAL